MGSDHFQISRVEMLIARIEIFRSNVTAASISRRMARRGLRSIFHVCLETVRGSSQSGVSWHFNMALFLSVGRRENCLQRCYSPIHDSEYQDLCGEGERVTSPCSLCHSSRATAGFGLTVVNFFAECGSTGDDATQVSEVFHRV